MGTSSLPLSLSNDSRCAVSDVAHESPSLLTSQIYRGVLVRVLQMLHTCFPVHNTSVVVDGQ